MLSPRNAMSHLRNKLQPTPLRKNRYFHSIDDFYVSFEFVLLKINYSFSFSSVDFYLLETKNNSVHFSLIIKIIIYLLPSGRVHTSFFIRIYVKVKAQAKGSTIL